VAVENDSAWALYAAANPGDANRDEVRIRLSARAGRALESKTKADADAEAAAKALEVVDQEPPEVAGGKVQGAAGAG